MRFRSAWPVPLLVAAVNCGYVGPVVPPSTRIPMPISDLSVAERGDRLLIQFTTPPRTTDNVNIKGFESIDLRITAQNGAKQDYQVPLPPPLTREEISRITPIQDSIPVAEWAGQRIEVQVRTAIRIDDRYSAWSNGVSLDAVPPLAPPDVNVQPSPAGYVVTWTPTPEGVSHRILRATTGMKAPVEVATVLGNTFTDNAGWGIPYTYSVIAVKGVAESLISKPVTVDAPDIYPPSTPGDVTAVASPKGVEISWQRVPEGDVRGYYIYRSEAGQAPTRIGGPVVLPVFTDTTPEHGKTYSYQVSAVDTSGNESPKSPPSDVDVP